MTASIEIFLIALTVSISCSTLGIFLLLKKMTMMSDAITHTVILGIVIAFLIVHDLSSPFLIIGASIIGVLTVWLSELLRNTKLVSEDSSIGIIFPFLFSIAIILITKYTGSIHLDTDSVLLGELAFAPFNRFVVFGSDLGPWILYQSIFVLILNLLFIFLFYKELKLNIFDSVLGRVLGFAPTLIHYALMTLVSITTVSSFESVGAILVVSFIIAPSLTAYLLSVDLKKIILYSFFISATNALIGCLIANIFDVSIAGSIASVSGLTFFLAFIFSPKCGFITMHIKKATLKLEFLKLNAIFCIIDLEKNNLIVTFELLEKHLNWSYKKTISIVNKLIKEGNILNEQGLILLTNSGRKITEKFKY